MVHENEADARRRLKTFQGPCTEPVERFRLCGVCRLADAVDGLRRCSKVVAESPGMQRMLARAGVAARSEAAVVIQGETGTGKEVVARLVHSNSARKSKPFVAVNVAALPPELLESELFGHVKGAFTGAFTTTHGLFGEADGGTLLLDEIGEMPLRLQAKLLRVLQEGEIRRVGETRARRIDVRVISATHRDIRALVAERAFREDLYYRLKVFALELPPLRERKPDVMPLANQFLERIKARNLSFSARAQACLERYAWPGNVRELGNVVEYAAAFAGEGSIEPTHLPDEVTAEPARPDLPAAELRTLAEVEHEHIQRVLAACDHNQVEAARRLGIGRSTLWRKLSAAP